MMQQMPIVAEYELEACKILISDAAYCACSQEQLARQRDTAKVIACGILERAGG